MYKVLVYRLLVIFLFSFLVNNSFVLAENSSQDNKCVVKDNHKVLWENIAGACVGAATSAATDIAGQYVAGNEEINWGEVSGAALSGAGNRSLNPIGTVGNTVKDLGEKMFEGFITGIGTRIYDSNKNDKK